MPGEVLWNAPVADHPVDALVRVPGSKSLTARWMLLAAAADEPSVLRGALVSRDTRLMRDALERLGAVLEVADGALHVTPLPPPAEHPAEPLEIHTGLAGTVMRFVPILAALHHGDVRFTGDDAALLRPMHAVVDALRQQGVEVTEHGEPGHLPLTVHGTGRLPGGRIALDASASSQFVSNVLLVAARAESDLELAHVGSTLPSLPHIDMTVQTLREAGVEASHHVDADGRHTWTVRRGEIRPVSVGIEPDLSNAGPFLAAAMVTGGTIAVDDWPETTTQPGDAYRDLLARMGGEVWREGRALCVRGSGEIHGIEADMSAVGELVPTIAALCALADSPSRLTGVAHLRGHETDRLKALAAELTKVGAHTVELEDGVEIHPGPLTGAVFESYEDHRMATAGAILGLRVPDLRVVDIGTTQKTLPDFVGMWLSMLHPEPAVDAE
ncbi:3-phosphoshikimate 1-carboxyvinyltransferase [Brachybacterium saurashtrense]|uniref:3-phosphoshikimate 1-carboxyvinyltransferase n=1 Tax=Brachybacterium saurashtrense TaxID=556288 RepID=A0A345YNB8_9MICO|nr:3-phosphoshikimate 1-carboxyvinyltransferase [Brachybacterium saurashtrense]AXK45420.1 3-phosphoshikimate 1-carboxyvinyltransferase [Brachybacterium saurashtrense]RRR21823.1 3-phosphoshikimate 1-carboxyvinyltransferase [Brachybacterium saurashtrense]